MKRQVKIDLDDAANADMDKVQAFYRQRGIRVSQTSVIRSALKQVADNLPTNEQEPGWLKPLGAS